MNTLLAVFFIVGTYVPTGQILTVQPVKDMEQCVKVEHL